LCLIHSSQGIHCSYTNYVMTRITLYALVKLLVRKDKISGAVVMYAMQQKHPKAQQKKLKDMIRILIA